MMENFEMSDIKLQITDAVSDIFVDLFDKGFEVKQNPITNKNITIVIYNDNKFNISEIQSKVLMFRDFFKNQYSHVYYEVGVKKQYTEFRHFPLFFYNKIKYFKIIMTF